MISLTKSYHAAKDVRQVRSLHERNHKRALKKVAAFQAKRPKSFFEEQALIERMTNKEQFNWIKAGMPK